MINRKLLSMFASRNHLLEKINQQLQVLSSFELQPRDIPAAVLRLEKTHMQLLKLDWYALEHPSTKPAKQISEVTLHKNPLRETALQVFNQFFNYGFIDQKQIDSLSDKMAEVGDLQDYFAFTDKKSAYQKVIKDYLATLESDIRKTCYQRRMYYEKPGDDDPCGLKWRPSTPYRVKKISTLLKEMRKDEDKLDKPHDLYFHTFTRVYDLLADSSHRGIRRVHEDTREFYNRNLKQIQTMGFKPLQAIEEAKVAVVKP